MAESLIEKLRNNFDSALSGGLETGAAVLSQALSDALVGQVAPGIVTAYLSYKQKRTDKMIVAAITDINDRLSTLEEKLNKFSTEDWTFFKEAFLPVFLDAVADEQQEEKIALLVNGFQTVIEYRLTDIDIIILYYDIVSQLRIFDLKTFMWFVSKTDVEAYAETSINRDDIYQSSVNHVVKKLEKLHLIGLPRLYGEMDGDEYTISRGRVKLTVLGERFIDFFRMKGDPDGKGHGGVYQELS